MSKNTPTVKRQYKKKNNNKIDISNHNIIPDEGKNIEQSNISNGVVEDKSLEVVEDKQLEVVEDKQLEVVEDKSLEVVEDNPLEVVEDKQLEVVEDKSMTPDNFDFNGSINNTLNDTLNDTLNEIKEELQENFNKSIKIMNEKEYILDESELINILSGNNNMNLKYTYKELKKVFSQFNDNIILVQILNGIIKFIEKKGSDSRNQSVIDIIVKANNYKKLPDVQFLVYTGDNIFKNDKQINDYLLTFYKNVTNKNYLFPHFNFNNWYEIKIGDYSDIYNNFIENKIEWESKEDIVFWNGISNDNIIKDLYNTTKDNKKYLIEIIEKNSEYYKISDYSKYKYLININGNSYPCCLNYLFLSGACVIILKDRNNLYEEYFHSSFIPNEDYLEIIYGEEDNMTDILDKIESSMNVYNCKKIAETCFNKATEIFNLNNIYDYIYNLTYLLSKNSTMNSYLENTVMYTPILDNYYKDRLKINNNRLIFNFLGDGFELKIIDINNIISLKISNNNTEIQFNEEIIYNKYTPFILNKNINQNYEININNNKFSIVINKLNFVKIDLPIDNFIISNSEIKTLNGGWWLF